MKWESDSPCRSHTYADRDADPLEGAVAGSWSLGIVEQSLGEGCCWLQRDRLRGCGGVDYGGKCLWRKAGHPWKQGDTAESCTGSRVITIASLPPHVSLGSWKIERLAHPWPDHWTTEWDPTKGASLSDWCTKLEKDPRQGSTLSAWMAGATEKDWPKRPDRQLQEAWKKTEMGS